MRRIVVVSLLAATGCVFATDFDSFHQPGGASDGGSAPAPSGKDDGGEASPHDAGADGGTDASDAAPAPSDVLFTDDFNRADGPVGNGWIEGQSGLYAIANNGVRVKGTNNFAYQKTFLYRPAQPEALNVSASVEVTLNALPPSYPQVHVRSSGGGDNPKCYAMGLPSSTSFFFGRCAPKNDFQVFSEDALSEKVAVGRTYRLTIAVSGTNPVHLDVAVERRDGDSYTTIGHDQTDDADQGRVTTTGMFGVSADTSPNWVYDNFKAESL